MLTARVFPRSTKATPDDALAFVGEPDLLTPEWFDEVHISVAFTYDMPYAERLAGIWTERTDSVFVGGPGTGMAGDKFIAGRYLKFGYVITSRGCPNACWFCSVPKREGDIRELPIVEGWNVLDDNLLACSDQHIMAVFEMLEKAKHKYHKPVEFTGGLEAKRLQDWHCGWINRLHPKQIFFAYDMEDDLEPLINAGVLLAKNEISFNSSRCYVLCGFKGDTFYLAEGRMMQTIRAGFIPMAMLYRDEYGNYDKSWSKFQKEWTRPAIMRAKGLI